jgi:DNA-directed RNA polymerase subunit RPC12/RpoP
MRIDLACAECGSNSFGLEGAETDNALIYCQECGHKIGTLGELKERTAQEVLRRRAEHN